MNKKIYITHKKIEYFLLLFFLQISFLSIKCQKCEGCTYSKIDNTTHGENCENCRHYHATEDSTYDCNTNSNNYQFYIIYDNQSCQYKDKCDNKVIFETNECVGHCPSDSFELGDYCYYKIHDEMEEITESPLRTLKCKYKYKKTKDLGDRVKYECYNNATNCEKYYDGDTFECIDKCENKFIKIENDGQKRCSSKCNNDEYIHIENQTCSSDCQKYYYETLDGPKKCVNECNFGDIYMDKKCVKDCNDSLIKFDILDDKNVKQCFKFTNTDETENNYFYYNNIYFKNCSDTQELFKKITYQYDNNCTDDCSFTRYTFL